MTNQRSYHQGILLLLLGALGGCSFTSQPVAIDPQVNFAAHLGVQGLMIDRSGGTSTSLRVRRPLFSVHGPTFLLTSGDSTIATVWTGGGIASVRAGADRESEVVGQVEKRGTDNGIRLTFRSRDGAAFHTDTFERVDGGSSHRAIGQPAMTMVEMRGTYFADIHSAAGATVGWLRVRILPPGEPLRIYDGVLPAEVDYLLAAVAAATLDSTVQWVEDHTQDADAKDD